MFQKNTITLMKNNKESRINNCSELPQGLMLKITGENNVVKIGQDCLFDRCILVITNNNASVDISHRCNIHNLVMDIGSGQAQRLIIGYNCTFFGGRIILRDSSFLKINDHCLFGAGLTIWTTDAHTIFDAKTKQVVNKTPAKLEIGNHCWIGGDVHILKNGSLPDETVVGMCSVVTKSFTEPHTVIGGYPAKVLKQGINWSRETIPNWLKQNQETSNT